MSSHKTLQFISFHSDVTEFFAKYTMLNVQFSEYWGFWYWKKILKIKIEYAQSSFRVFLLPLVNVFDFCLLFFVYLMSRAMLQFRAWSVKCQCYYSVQQWEDATCIVYFANRDCSLASISCSRFLAPWVKRY